jgi:hypothetical protein
MRTFAVFLYGILFLYGAAHHVGATPINKDFVGSMAMLDSRRNAYSDPDNLEFSAAETETVKTFAPTSTSSTVKPAASEQKKRNIDLTKAEIAAQEAVAKRIELAAKMEAKRIELAEKIEEKRRALEALQEEKAAKIEANRKAVAALQAEKAAKAKVMADQKAEAAARATMARKAEQALINQNIQAAKKAADLARERLPPLKRQRKRKSLPTRRRQKQRLQQKRRRREQRPL